MKKTLVALASAAFILGSSVVMAAPQPGNKDAKPSTSQAAGTKKAQKTAKKSKNKNGFIIGAAAGAVGIGAALGGGGGGSHTNTPANGGTGGTTGTSGTTGT